MHHSTRNNSMSSSSLASPRHSTRNNYIIELPMHDNMTITYISNDEKKTPEKEKTFYNENEVKVSTRETSNNVKDSIKTLMFNLEKKDNLNV